LKPISSLVGAVLAATLLCAPVTAVQQPATGLLNPDAIKLTAPEKYTVLLDTTVGTIVIAVTRAWAPLGADRFYTLVKHGFYDGNRFFRVVPKFMAQFGLHGDPAVSAVWKDQTMASDRARVSNTRGRVTFAQGALASSRTTQVFINFGDNSRLDIDNFAPFGEVTSSMILAERVFSDYGEGPDQGRIIREGNAFLIGAFPRLSYIRKATIE
jgi:peptidyl-prolyl cis-trans isomerase A (cyclophilin A)